MEGRQQAHARYAAYSWSKDAEVTYSSKLSAQEPLNAAALEDGHSKQLCK